MIGAPINRSRLVDRSIFVYQKMCTISSFVFIAVKRASDFRCGRLMHHNPIHLTHRPTFDLGININLYALVIHDAMV